MIPDVNAPMKTEAGRNRKYEIINNNTNVGKKLSFVKGSWYAKKGTRMKNKAL